MNELEHELCDEVDHSSFQLMSGTSIIINSFEGKGLVGCEFAYGWNWHLNLKFQV